MKNWTLQGKFFSAFLILLQNSAKKALQISAQSSQLLGDDFLRGWVGAIFSTTKYTSPS